MSITHRADVSCRGCAAPLEVSVASSVNAGRHPHLRQLVLDRELHRFTCGACGAQTVIETAMSYFDLERRQCFAIYPRDEIRRAEERAEAFAESARRWLAEWAPASMRRRSGSFLVRVCFGYEELREKLVCDDARLFDVALEALKCELLRSDPTFEELGIPTLRLESADEDELRLRPEWERPPPVPAPVFAVDRAHYRRWLSQPDAALLPRLVHGPHVSALRLALEHPEPSRPST